MQEAVLYSFRRCPYAMRARWALINYNIKVLVREVELKNKPSELLKISKKATVPVLITSRSTVIEESIDIMKWAINQNNYKNSKKANRYFLSKEETLLIEENDNLFKFHLDRYKYPNRYLNNDINQSRFVLKSIILKWSNLISESSRNDSSGWLIGEKESIADWALWPFVRQYRMVNSLEFDNDKKLNSLREWLKYYTSHYLFPILMKKQKTWKKGEKEIQLTTKDSLNNLLF